MLHILILLFFFFYRNVFIFSFLVVIFSFSSFYLIFLCVYINCQVWRLMCIRRHMNFGIPAAFLICARRHTVVFLKNLGKVRIVEVSYFLGNLPAAHIALF